MFEDEMGAVIELILNIGRYLVVDMAVIDGPVPAVGDSLADTDSTDDGNNAERFYKRNLVTRL